MVLNYISRWEEEGRKGMGKGGYTTCAGQGVGTEQGSVHARTGRKREGGGGGGALVDVVGRKDGRRKEEGRREDSIRSWKVPF
jgi:hypothetical protein